MNACDMRMTKLGRTASVQHRRAKLRDVILVIEKGSRAFSSSFYPPFSLYKAKAHICP